MKKLFVEEMEDKELLIALSYIIINSLSIALLCWLVMENLKNNNSLIKFLLMILTMVTLLSGYWFKIFCNQMIYKYEL